MYQMDRMALEHSKRCIMWDDEGVGFYLVRQLQHQDVCYTLKYVTSLFNCLQQMVNWDWLTNQPAKMPKDRAFEPGWCEPDSGHLIHVQGHARQKAGYNTRLANWQVRCQQTHAEATAPGPFSARHAAGGVD